MSYNCSLIYVILEYGGKMSDDNSKYIPGTDLVKFEYVQSGLAYTRVTTSRYNGEAMQKLMDKAFIQHPDFYLSGLFNAYVEKGVTRVLDRFNFHEIHVDSGGLQMALQNKQITPEFKREIYQTQGQWGTIAMCFDEIPLYVRELIKSESSSNRTRIDNKLYLPELAKEKAEHTGRNVNEQLRILKDMGSKCKVMMIAQGNKAEDFAEFIETQYAQIDPDLRDGIKGIALADTCIGNGVMESVEMLHGLKLINIPKQYKTHVHLLGVGSLTRMMPVIELVRSGFLDHDLHVSIDSTSHTSAYVMGKLIDIDGRMTSLGTGPSEDNIRLFTDIYNDYMREFYGDSYRDDYIKFMTTNLRGSTHIHQKDTLGDMAYLTYSFAPLIYVKRFMLAMNDCRKSFDNYHKYMKNKEKLISAMYQLSKVKTLDDMEEFKQRLGPYVDSKRIPRKSEGVNKQITMDDFF